MWALLIIVLPVAVYLLVEERERRAANPGGLPWGDRVRASAKEYHFVLIFMLVGLEDRVTRGKDWIEIAWAAIVPASLYLFYTLHQATRSLPRADE